MLQGNADLSSARTSRSSSKTLMHNYQANDFGVIRCTCMRANLRGAVRRTGVGAIVHGTL